MPIIVKVTKDLFEFDTIPDGIVNPVNTQGEVGTMGIATEFRRRAPDFVERYRDACRTGELRMGTAKVIDDVSSPFDVWCLATKRAPFDATDRDDVARALEGLRDLLLTDTYKYASIAMPMLGCGLGERDYEVVYPLMMETLHDLDATIFLGMAPNRTEMRPRYLVIVGPPDYGLTKEDKDKIDEIIEKSLAHWGATLDDYDGIVSGGYPGVDSYIGGCDYRKRVEDTYVYRKTGKEPYVVKPNPKRNGVTASLKHHHLLCEIGSDFILFKPAGHNNNRMSLMQKWINEERESRAEKGYPPRRVTTFGEKDISLKNEAVLVGVKEDDYEE